MTKYKKNIKLDVLFLTKNYSLDREYLNCSSPIIDISLSTSSIMQISIVPSNIQLLIVNIYFFYKKFSLD